MIRCVNIECLVLNCLEKTNSEFKLVERELSALGTPFFYTIARFRYCILCVQPMWVQCLHNCKAKYEKVTISVNNGALAASSCLIPNMALNMLDSEEQ